MSDLPKSWSAAGFEARPGARACSLVNRRRRQIDINPPADVPRWIDRGVVADLGFDQRGRGHIRVRVPHRIGDAGDHLGAQQVVDKTQRALGMRRIGGDANMSTDIIAPSFGTRKAILTSLPASRARFRAWITSPE